MLDSHCPLADVACGFVLTEDPGKDIVPIESRVTWLVQCVFGAFQLIPRQPGGYYQSGPYQRRNSETMMCSIQKGAFTNEFCQRSPMISRLQFDYPPVIEVVFSVAFALRQPFKSAHFGVFWQRIRNQFPRMEDNPPLPPTLIPQADGTTTAQFAFMSVPPLRRVWFLDNEGRDIIQVQDDRFIFNWKRNPTDVGYPGYDEISSRFESHWKTFKQFLSEEDIEIVSLNLLELVYVNDIDHSNGLAGEITLHNLFIDHVRVDQPNRFLPEAIAFNWGTTYTMPEGSGALTVIAQAPAEPGRKGSVRVDMVARGVPQDLTESSRLAWYNLAHEWLTKGFGDVLQRNIQDVNWRRTA